MTWGSGSCLSRTRCGTTSTQCRTSIADVVGRLELHGAPVALTTTAELVDVFASKREGVLYVLDAARQALPDRRLRVMTTGGELVSLDAARAEPLACAAANWMATALWSRARCPTRSWSTAVAPPPT